MAETSALGSSLALVDGDLVFVSRTLTDGGKQRMGPDPGRGHRGAEPHPGADAMGAHTAGRRLVQYQLRQEAGPPSTQQHVWGAAPVSVEEIS
jgi:hypothetical protein